VEPLTLRRLWSDYWKVPVVGLLAAVLAFLGSFVLSPTYQSSTNLLVRARNTTFLSGNGTSLNQTPAVLDSDLATALSDTQGALLSTDTVARMVVQQLQLDKPKPKPNGPIATVRRAFSSLYHHTKAFLMFGTYSSPGRFDGAVQAVNSGLSGAQVKNSFVLQLTAQADNPKLASAIANAAANSLVTIANERFAQDSLAYRDLLKQQLDVAQADQARATNAVASFQRAHGITDITTELALSAKSQSDLQTQLQSTQTELSDAQAQLASVESQLSSTPAETSSSQKITTGRSSTTIDNTQSSPIYQNLRAQEASLRARASGLGAQLGALRSAVSNSKPSGPLTSAQARLQQLALQQQIAQETVHNLATQYQQSKLSTVNNTVELTRVDTAVTPNMPIAPRRYMYIAVGLVLGMVLGFVSAQLGLLRRRREDEEAAAAEAADGETDAIPPQTIDLTPPPSPVAVPAQRSREETLAERLLQNGEARYSAPEGES
jgi:uncharacterized protein involved in exopolysaccharide biosynthesis